MPEPHTEKQPMQKVGRIRGGERIHDRQDRRVGKIRDGVARLRELREVGRSPFPYAASASISMRTVRPRSIWHRLTR